MMKKIHNRLTADGSVFPFYGELGTINLNSLTGNYYGVYQQSKSGNVYSGLNYPLDSPGSLIVLPTKDNVGCSQEYRPYNNNALYRRRYFLSTSFWTWSAWIEEYNSETPAIPSGRRANVEQLPAGAVVLWPSADAPEGWFICDGSTFSQEDFPKLACVLPDGKLPSLSGMLKYIIRAV